MKKRLVALALVLALVLCGCVWDEDPNVWRTEMYYRDMTLLKYSEMEYQRPDMSLHGQVLEESCTIALESTDLDEVLDAIYTYYDEYDWFYANYALANIRYSANLMDIYWEQEYNFCAERTAEVDAGLDRLYHALAQSPVRDELEGVDYFGPGYFDAYEGESIWDETFTSMMEQEAQLINQYYALSAEEEDWLPRGELLAQLVLLRQKIAGYLGYESYNQFAYDFYYYRDYTPEQVETYLEEIRKELVPTYLTLDDRVWEAGYTYCSEADTFAYLEGCVRNMGGMVDSAFNLLQRYELYDLDYSENKYNASFEMFISYYCEPFVFMNPQGCQADKLTLVHEFGHFANDYACIGSYAGIDVAEVYSQALEYLSLMYAPGGERLTEYKLAECLCVFVEQAAYAAFEHRLYEMAPEEVTAESIRALFQQVGEEYGFTAWNFDSQMFVDITHFYTNPQYVISYVVSNDAAFQIYQMELAETGSGLTLYQNSLGSMQSWFLMFLEEQGLVSPFTEGRVAQVRQTLEGMIK